MPIDTSRALNLGRMGSPQNVLVALGDLLGRTVQGTGTIATFDGAQFGAKSLGVAGQTLTQLATVRVLAPAYTTIQPANAAALVLEAVAGIGSSKNLSLWSKGDAQFDGAISGSGASLTSLNASALASGTVPDAPLVGAAARIVGVNAANSTEVSNIATWTTFDKTVTIPAALLTVGRLFRITTSGKFSCGSNATFTFQTDIGGIAIGGSSGSAVAGWSDEGWTATGFIRIDSTGTSGTFTRWGVNGAVRTSVTGVVNSATGTINTTANALVQAYSTWSVAHAGNKATQTMLLVEVLN